MRRADLFLVVVLSVSFLAVSPVRAAPIDLSSWSADGRGNWTLQTQDETNDSVFESLNSGPSVFFNNMESQGLFLSGTIEVQTTTDDDFVGFVLGYDPGDVFGSNATTDYILVDWKQGAQSGQNPGMRISRVTGAIDTCGTCTNSNAWNHTGNVSVIQDAATLGDVAWADNTSYMFDILFTSTNIQVDIDGVQQFSINGVFENGSFGFYNFSQPSVLYAGIGSGVIPEPSTAILMGLGLLAMGTRSRQR